jgi:hypothetical protein
MLIPRAVKMIVAQNVARRVVNVKMDLELEILNLKDQVKKLNYKLVEQHEDCIPGVEFRTIIGKIMSVLDDDNLRKVSELDV